MLLRNSARDGRKGGKLVERWLGPYEVNEHIGKGVYRLQKRYTGRILKRTYNSSRFESLFVFSATEAMSAAS